MLNPIEQSINHSYFPENRYWFIAISLYFIAMSQWFFPENPPRVAFGVLSCAICAPTFVHGAPAPWAQRGRERGRFWPPFQKRCQLDRSSSRIIHDVYFLLSFRVECSNISFTDQIACWQLSSHRSKIISTHWFSPARTESIQQTGPQTVLQRIHRVLSTLAQGRQPKKPAEPLVAWDHRVEFSNWKTCWNTYDWITSGILNSCEQFPPHAWAAWVWTAQLFEVEVKWDEIWWNEPREKA